MQFISAKDIYRICQWRELMDALESAHRGVRPITDRTASQHTRGKEQQSYINISAWQPDIAFASKIITVMPDNPSRHGGTPAIQALVTLFDGETGTPRAVLDGTSLTYVKTAADSALGSRFLSRPDSEILTLVGTGGLAPYVLRAHLAARPAIRTVFIWGRRREAAKAVLSRLSGEKVSVHIADDLKTAVERSDIVSCVTGSAEPLVMGKWLKPGCHLDLIGGFTPKMRECDDEAIERARVFVDSPWDAVKNSGDICDPIERGVISKMDIEADLFNLCNGHYSIKRKASDITLFKNGGGAHLDLYTAMFVASRIGDSA